MREIICLIRRSSRQEGSRGREGGGGEGGGGGV